MENEGSGEQIVYPLHYLSIILLSVLQPKPPETAQHWPGFLTDRSDMKQLCQKNPLLTICKTEPKGNWEMVSG